MTHFYTLVNNEVETRHEVPMTKDPSRLRPSRTTDAKKAYKEKGEVWLPSVTTVMDVLAKHALIDWKIDQHLVTAYGMDIEYDALDMEEWIAKAKELTEEKLDEAPRLGTDIHNVLENFIKHSVIPSDEIEKKICVNVKKALDEYCGDDEIWTTEKYFCDESKGYAGCADLLSRHWCIDYKSKKEARKFKPGRMVYKEHHMQLAAYSKGLEGGFLNCANIFVCLENGEIDFHPHSLEDIEKGWKNFKDCLNLYHRNNYNPLEYDL